MAVGIILALYRFCGLYNWIANVISNVWFSPKPQVPPAEPTTPSHPIKLNLPAFWRSEPVAWFALSEAKFRTANITQPESDVQLACCRSSRDNPGEAHTLSDQEKLDALFQLGPLGDCKPSQLLVMMLSMCPSEWLKPMFQYLFL